MKKYLKYISIYLLISSPCFSLTKETLINESFNGSNPKTCYNRSLMNATMGENINYDDIFIQRQDILSKAYKRTTTHPIPKISHHIWITNADNPKEINAKNIDHIKKTFKFISKNNGWRNIFWTNNKELIPETIDKLSEFNIEVKEINGSNLDNFSSVEDLYNKSFDYNLAMPSDIASYAILAEYGGVYIDVDYELYQSLDQLLNQYSFLAHEEPMKNLYIGNAFIAASANHPIINKSIALVKRNFSSDAPEYIKLACHDRAFTISAVGPVTLSLAFFDRANSNDEYNDTFMTNNEELYKNCNFIIHKDIGKHYGSNTWKKYNESVMYPHCQECVKFKHLTFSLTSIVN